MCGVDPRQPEAPLDQSSTSLVYQLMHTATTQNTLNVQIWFSNTCKNQILQPLR